MLERYLDELRAQGLPKEMVNEARMHLEESIQARLELGVDPEVAERQAIQAFGVAKQVGEAQRKRAPFFDIRFCGGIVAVAVLQAISASVFFDGSLRDLSVLFAPFTIALPAAALFVLSSRTVRFQWLATLIAATLLIAGGPIGHRLDDVWIRQSTVRLTRAETGRWIERDLGRIATNEALIRKGGLPKRQLARLAKSKYFWREKVQEMTHALARPRLKDASRNFEENLRHHGSSTYPSWLVIVFSGWFVGTKRRKLRGSGGLRA